MTYLFIDTNVLLHYRRLEEIDWLALSKSNEVVIVLCPAVIRELDHHKVSHPQNKFRKRAQEIIASLHSRLTGATSDLIRDNVRLEFLAVDPDLDFVKHKLRTELVDDWLIASAINWRREHPSDEIKLISADLGLSIKAKAQRITVLTPLESDKLVEELDAEEKRIKKLQEELTQLKNSLPDLKLCFEDAKELIRVKIQPSMSVDTKQIESEMIQVRTKHPLHAVPDDSPKKAKEIRTVGDWEKFQKLLRKGGKVEMVWPREDILRYNSSMESFYSEYEKYLQTLHDHQNVVRRTIQFGIALENLGGSPAEDVDIHFHFPSGFHLFDAERDAIPKPPEPPDPPAELGKFRLDRHTMDAMRNIGSYALGPRMPGPPPNVSSPSIRQTNSYDVQSHVRRAKHGYQIHVAHFVAIFDSYESAGSFKIDYSILAANVPKPTIGHLSIVVEK